MCGLVGLLYAVEPAQLYAGPRRPGIAFSLSRMSIAAEPTFDA